MNKQIGKLKSNSIIRKMIPLIPLLKVHIYKIWGLVGTELSYFFKAVQQIKFNSSSLCW